MVKVIVAVIVVIILGAAGYAVFHNSNSYSAPKSSNSTGSTPAQTDTAPTQNTNENQAQTQPQSGTTASVTISNFAFSPANLTVKKGTTVTWTNQDVTAHTVTETDGKNGPASQDLNQGQSYSFTYTTPGTYKYDCSIHTYMTGTVTVTD